MHELPWEGLDDAAGVAPAGPDALEAGLEAGDGRCLLLLEGRVVELPVLQVVHGHLHPLGLLGGGVDLVRAGGEGIPVEALPLVPREGQALLLVELGQRLGVDEAVVRVGVIDHELRGGRSLVAGTAAVAAAVAGGGGSSILAGGGSSGHVRHGPAKVPGAASSSSPPPVPPPSSLPDAAASESDGVASDRRVATAVAVVEKFCLVGRRRPAAAEADPFFLRLFLATGGVCQYYYCVR
mmetsp:Transcript_8676/g.24381  ORF Transcript_8676/g.24381 Transcript_8676/m.24381 type:complete len:238 (+) Transcript_8676:556-1269(+)